MMQTYKFRVEILTYQVPQFGPQEEDLDLVQISDGDEDGDEGGGDAGDSDDQEALFERLRLQRLFAQRSVHVRPKV